MNTDLNQDNIFDPVIMDRKIPGTHIGDASLPMGIFNHDISMLKLSVNQSVNDLSGADTRELALWGITLANMLMAVSARFHNDCAGNPDILIKNAVDYGHSELVDLYNGIRRLERITVILTQAVRNIAYNLCGVEFTDYVDYCVEPRTLEILRDYCDDVTVAKPVGLNAQWHHSVYLLDDALERFDYGLPDACSLPLGGFVNNLSSTTQILQYALKGLHHQRDIEKLIKDEDRLKQCFRRIFVASLLGPDQQIQVLFNVIDDAFIGMGDGDPLPSNVMNVVENTWELLSHGISHFYDNVQ